MKAVTPFADYVAALDEDDDFSVFPIKAGAKTPATAHGFKDATSDRAQLQSWASELPDANVGHSPEHSGHFVLDVDPRNGGDKTLASLVVKHGALPETYTVQTPSGGKHYWFRGSAPSSAGRLGPGLDIRGSGGYVLLEGSRTPQGEYKTIVETPTVAAPAWLQELAATPFREAIKSAPHSVLDSPANISRATLFLKEAPPAIEGQGGDLHTLATAAALRDLGVSQDAAVELLEQYFNPRCEPPWSHEELAVKVANAYRYSKNEPGAYAVGDPNIVFSEYLKNAVTETATNALPKERVGRRAIVLRDEGMQSRREPPKMLVDGFIPERGTVGIFAPFSSFKSFTATDILLSVASGLPVFNKLAVSKSGPAIYLAGEGVAGFETLRRPAWRIARNIPAERKLPIYTVEGLPLVRDPEDVARYMAAIEELGQPPTLIVIDPVARAMAGLNENDAGDAGIYLNMVEDMAARFGCSVLSIMHEGKDQSRGARGSSAFPAGFDAVWKQEANEDTLTATITPIKLKDDAAPEPISIRGRNVFVPSAGKSTLVFDWIPLDEAKPRKGSISRSDVGRTLQRLNAVNGKTITTHALATSIAEPGADVQIVLAIEKTLRRGVDTKFAAYVAHKGEGRGDATLWSFPADVSLSARAA